MDDASEHYPECSGAEPRARKLPSYHNEEMAPLLWADETARRQGNDIVKFDLSSFNAGTSCGEIVALLLLAILAALICLTTAFAVCVQYWQHSTNPLGSEDDHHTVVGLIVTIFLVSISTVFLGCMFCGSSTRDARNNPNARLSPKFRARLSSTRQKRLSATPRAGSPAESCRVSSCSGAAAASRPPAVHPELRHRISREEEEVRSLGCTDLPEIGRNVAIKDDR